MKTSQNTYYVALNRQTDEIKVSTSKASVARFLSIHVSTLNTHLENNTLVTPKWRVWTDVKIEKRKTGFALK